MKYRTLGRTNITVSEMAMGCEGFSEKTPDECKKMVDAAINNGINFFDMYSSDPDLRKNVGNALSEYPRDKYVIQGHLCSAWQDGQYIRTRDPELVKSSFSDLLSFMKLDFADIGMIHYSDEEKDYDDIMAGEVMKYAVSLKNEGKIKNIGISTHNTDVAMKAAESGIIDVIMFSINPAYDMLPASEDVNILFERSTFEREYNGIDPKREKLYTLCRNNGVALTVMKCFAGGLLLDEKQSPFEKAMSVHQCIAYCLDRPGVSAVMGGMSDTEEITEAVKYYSLSPEEKDYSMILASAPKKSFSGHCMYCSHCAPCSAGIDIADVNKYLDLSLAQGFVPETAGNHYELLHHHAGECIGCGQCESRCPFGVKIIEKMKTAVSVFGK